MITTSTYHQHGETKSGGEAMMRREQKETHHSWAVVMIGEFVAYYLLGIIQGV